MTILVTGATGFVGAAVLRRLVAAGHECRVLARARSDRRNLTDISCSVAEGDLGRPESLAPALAGCTALFHVAADYRIFVPDPAGMDRVNVDGTVALIRAAMAAGVTRIVYTSSVATLRLDAGGAPANEDSVAAIDDMIGAYKRSKFRAEQAVARLVREEGAPVVIVQPSTPIGPRDVKPTPTGRLIVEAARGRIPAFVDTGLNVVHVDDVAAGHLLAFEHGAIGRRYILGGENLALRDILGVVARLTGRRAPRIRLAPGPLMPLALIAESWARLTGGREPMLTRDGLRMSRKSMFFASDRARTELGYAHRPAEAAIADAIAWFRANDYLG
jgi:dihydroflavonol-4-reductase